MLLIRPIKPDDLDALHRLAVGAGPGFTSLPPEIATLRAKIERSQRSFAEPDAATGAQRYLFVLEDSTSGTIGGCCAIEAACGLEEPFYSYHVGLTVHASDTLGVYKRVPTLYLSNDLTGSSVLCSLYLSPAFRGARSGHLLSKCRFLFMASHRQHFPDKVIAELRGVSDEAGRSPFWEGLGRHFFDIDYDSAEHAVGQGNKACIAELMPRHPIYTNLLPAAAQAVMGRVHPHTAPALHLLSGENFRYQNYIDIFDGGPTVEAPVDAVRAIHASRVLDIAIEPRATSEQEQLVANLSFERFRCVLVPVRLGRERAGVTAEVAAALGLSAGDAARIVSP